HTRFSRDWSSDVCSSDLIFPLSCGATAIVDSERGHPSRILGVLLTHRPTKFFSIPTIYSRLAPIDAVNTELFASVDLCVSAGERSEERRVGKEWRCRWWL